MAAAKEFDEATQRELQSFIEQQQAQARVQQSIHTFNDMCWTKCITGTPSNRFSSKEEQCLVNCVDRFLDSSLFIVKRLEEQRNAAGQ
ncbi:uncharacterized protein L969DRAFT_44268 [Mixia osmundae IAM 14324]|uniref:Mitochondrial import inner membrane translocase subunit n=1 Tax=Mixia osmundae (strain CBS 9802 / IAM 14324 / JCM 22182 / KY 12970) TaxID=764103 RepID=G7DT40_MIXOS|nr:uncharacterized protein L969DRAFT_44268 [Mixia osmundae IAM 14324]KEI42748.1 hypothetical protein L969DRAFT_44268 [Mixia osmundae IAM 14324]GAA93919.1 hypothetical protein E5Q_00565 [Mixia osmundae IAM 14324]